MSTCDIRFSPPHTADLRHFKSTRCQINFVRRSSYFYIRPILPEGGKLFSICSDSFNLRTCHVTDDHFVSLNFSAFVFDCAKEDLRTMN